jgi:cell division protein FtsA
MTGVGLIQFAYRNAKIQGRKVGFKMPEQAVQEVAATHQKEVQQRPKPKSKQHAQAEKKPSKMKKIFNFFWE